MDKNEQAKTFLEWVGNNFDELQNRYKKWCVNKQVQYDEDIFSETYMKVYQKIERDGIQDSTPTGFDNYMFRAFTTNVKRESQYARNRLRDLNYTDDDIQTLWEKMQGMDTSKEKLLSDLFKDFSVIFIMKKVEEHFDSQTYNLFKLKYLGNLTFIQLKEKTQAKAIKEKISSVKKWLKENITKDDVRAEFNDVFSSLF